MPNDAMPLLREILVHPRSSRRPEPRRDATLPRPARREASRQRATDRSLGPGRYRSLPCLSGAGNIVQSSRGRSTRSSVTSTRGATWGCPSTTTPQRRRRQRWLCTVGVRRADQVGQGQRWHQQSGASTGPWSLPDAMLSYEAATPAWTIWSYPCDVSKGDPAKKGQADWVKAGRSTAYAAGGLSCSSAHVVPHARAGEASARQPPAWGMSQGCCHSSVSMSGTAPPSVVLRVRPGWDPLAGHGGLGDLMAAAAGRV